MAAGVQAFPAGQQGAAGGPYPLGQNTLDSRLVHSPHGGRTPGRGSFRTPFSYQPQSRLSQTQVSSIQRSPDASTPSQSAVSEATSAANSAAAGVVTELEALSVADDLGGRRLSPITTHAVLSPSDVIIASAARSRAAESMAAVPAQMTQAFAPDFPPLLSELQQSNPALMSTSASASQLQSAMGNEAAAGTQADADFASTDAV